MANYIRSDLEFILAQIKIAEAHADGAQLFGPDGLVPAYNLSLGLRTVDGTFNNILPGQETWGAAGFQFPELVDATFRPGYAPSNNPASMVVDIVIDLRTISNLIVDQTLGNPAAIMKGLEIGGVAPATMATVALVQAIYNVFKPFAHAAYQTGVVAANAQHLADVNLNPALQAGLDAAAAAAAATAAAADADLSTARGVRNLALEPFGIEMDGDNVQHHQRRARTRACRRRSIRGSRCSASSSITASTSSTRAAAARCSFRCSRTIRSTSRAATPTSWC